MTKNSIFPKKFEMRSLTGNSIAFFPETKQKMLRHRRRYFFGFQETFLSLRHTYVHM
jgi:hypothetical protein